MTDWDSLGDEVVRKRAAADASVAAAISRMNAGLHTPSDYLASQGPAIARVLRDRQVPGASRSRFQDTVHEKLPGWNIYLGAFSPESADSALLSKRGRWLKPGLPLRVPTLRHDDVRRALDDPAALIDLGYGLLADVNGAVFCYTTSPPEPLEDGLRRAVVDLLSRHQ